MKATLIVILLIALISYNHPPQYLILKNNNKGQYGYLDLKGHIIIPFGKYGMCFTDTFKKYAIVLKRKSGFVIIDRSEKVLYNVFPFDNGSDYLTEGYFRIIKNGKIGFANSNFNIIIKPQFGCAFPFKNGVAKVSNNCKTIKDQQGEHNIWISNDWFYIDKQGNKIKN